MTTINRKGEELLRFALNGEVVLAVSRAGSSARMGTIPAEAEAKSVSASEGVSTGEPARG